VPREKCMDFVAGRRGSRKCPSFPGAIVLECRSRIRLGRRLSSVRSLSLDPLALIANPSALIRPLAMHRCIPLSKSRRSASPLGM
jgi:hypothetical protein